MKLAAAGIGEQFARGQGGFGSDHEDARRAAGDRAPPRRRAPAAAPWPRERTLLIGDTPRDIACARADGVRVDRDRDRAASGAAELTDADAVARDARELGVAARRAGGAAAGGARYA